MNYQVPVLLMRKPSRTDVQLKRLEVSFMIQISKILELTMTNSEALSKAVEKGYVEVREDGTLAWMLESNTLLAYFCGRLWCGDKGMYSRRKKAMLWQVGDAAFPAVALGKVFGCTSLKQTRQRRKNMVLPEHFELIDYLFDTM